MRIIMSVQVEGDRTSLEIDKEVFETENSGCSEYIKIPMSKFKMFEKNDNFVLFTFSIEEN